MLDTFMRGNVNKDNKAFANKNLTTSWMLRFEQIVLKMEVY